LEVQFSKKLKLVLTKNLGRRGEGEPNFQITQLSNELTTVGVGIHYSEFVPIRKSVFCLDINSREEGSQKRGLIQFDTITPSKHQWPIIFSQNYRTFFTKI
jgi:hypothetical protein